MIVRARRLRPRVASSAVAAKNAADQDEWPLGNDGPSVSAIGLSVGRARSASSLTVVVTTPLPATTSAMNGITQRLRSADRLRDRHQRRERDDDLRLADVGDRGEHVRREAGRAAVAPLGDAAVDLHDLGVAADQVGEHGEDEPAEHDHRERQRQRETCRRLRIQAPRQRERATAASVLGAPARPVQRQAIAPAVSPASIATMTRAMSVMGSGRAGSRSWPG